jgi:hypothetical protein
MNRYEDPNNPKNPPQSLMRPKVRNAALWALVGSLVGFFTLVGVVLLFWTVAHPRPAAREGMERVVGPSGYYSTEGGHDPLEYRRPANTRDELKFRGTLTPPSEVRGR